ncbi:uncharacterized protein PAC_15262 [Phialocephala subalpina]|uniref:C2H2-type domain-containing protein n=1 Tax=Phialocephala subalpina TaxID=576137 RepID=A0A1L7XJY8_9HELO|nr:uncharacterized protein PAC_15262 [Phialocephala subalpina]
MELHDASFQRHVRTKETILTPPAIELLPADQIIDFHFVCKIPSDMKHHANDMVASILKTVNDYIENAHHGSERTPPTKSSQTLSIQDASEDTPQRGLTLGDPASTKKYCCTFCNGLFESMSSWKRHERDFHEPQRQWRCREPGCDKTYGQKDSATAVADVLPRKSGWGCGFCVNVFHTWKARCSHVAAHFEAVPRAYKKHWNSKTVMEGLLLQPKLVEVRNSLLGEARALIEIAPRGNSSVTPRAPDELLRDLQYLDEQQDHQRLVREALVYLGLHSGNTTRGSSPPPPSTTYFESSDGGNGYSLSTSDDFAEILGNQMTFMGADNGLDVGGVCQEGLFDDPNEHYGLGPYGYYTTTDDRLLYAPDFRLD